MKEAGGDKAPRQNAYTFLRTKELKKGATFAGTYLRQEKNIKYGNLEYYVQAESTTYVVPGSQAGIGMLNKKMAEVPVGSKVEITYGGKDIIQTGERAGTAANAWKVLYDAPTAPLPAAPTVVKSTASLTKQPLAAPKKAAVPTPPVIEEDMSSDEAADDDEEVMIF